MDRFWDKVTKTDGCWEWKAATRSGYGVIKVGGRSVSAHRLSWYLEHGEWPKKLVCHRCDNKLCVRPDHLYDGSHSDNLQDVIDKTNGKHFAKGSSVASSKLTEADVLEIRRLVKEGYTHKHVAGLFRVNRRSVGRIVSYEGWKHVA